MPEEKTKKRQRNKSQQVYRHKTNAIHITLYDPHGETIPAAIRNSASEALLQLAFENRLLINIATT